MHWPLGSKFHLRMQDGSLLEIIAEEMTQQYGFLEFSNDGVPFLGLRADTVRTWRNLNVKAAPIRAVPGERVNGKKAPIRRS